jgi:hypothetical protein
MGFFRKLFGIKEDETSYTFRRKMALSLHGQPVKYITERRDDNDDVVGRGGHIAVHEDDLILDSGTDTLFRCPIADVSCAMLMSGDGVIVSGPNALEDGNTRTFTVHFVYYRK